VSENSERQVESDPVVGGLVEGTKRVAANVQNGAAARALIGAAYDRVVNYVAGPDRKVWGRAMILVADGWNDQPVMEEVVGVLHELVDACAALSRRFAVPGLGKAAAFALIVVALSHLAVVVWAAERRVNELAERGGRPRARPKGRTRRSLIRARRRVRPGGRRWRRRRGLVFLVSEHGITSSGSPITVQAGTASGGSAGVSGGPFGRIPAELKRTGRSTRLRDLWLRELLVWHEEFQREHPNLRPTTRAYERAFMAVYGVLVRGRKLPVRWRAVARARERLANGEPLDRRFQKSGSKRKEYDPRLADRVREIILHQNRFSATDALEEEQRLAAELRVAPMTRWAVRKIIDELPAAAKAAGRNKSREFEAYYVPSVRIDYTDLPAGNWVCLDGRVADVEVRTPDGGGGWRAVRPVVLSILDMRSTKLSVEVRQTENYIGILAGLKTWVREYGLPEHMTIDNGRAYQKATGGGGGGGQSWTRSASGACLSALARASTAQFTSAPGVRSSNRSIGSSRSTTTAGTGHSGAGRRPSARTRPSSSSSITLKSCRRSRNSRKTSSSPWTRTTPRRGAGSAG